MRKHLIEIFALGVLFVKFLVIAFLAIGVNQFFAGSFFGFMATLVGMATSNKIQELKKL